MVDGKTSRFQFRGHLSLEFRCRSTTESTHHRLQRSTDWRHHWRRWLRVRMAEANDATFILLSDTSSTVNSEMSMWQSKPLNPSPRSVPCKRQRINPSTTTTTTRPTPFKRASSTVSYAKHGSSPISNIEISSSSSVSVYRYRYETCISSWSMRTAAL